MLGPEQINAPGHLTTLAASDASHLRVNHEVGRSLGLMNHQIIKGADRDAGSNHRAPISGPVHRTTQTMAGANWSNSHLSGSRNLTGL